MNAVYGGTGECTGIEGKMLTKPQPKTISSKEGTYQQIVLTNVTWKIRFIRLKRTWFHAGL
jgi:hypothetical protein